MKKRILRSTFYFLLCVAFILIVILALILEPTTKIRGFAELDNNRLRDISSTVSVYYENGNDALVEGRTKNNTTFIKLNEIPHFVKNAFVAIEDKRFYKHNGVDYYRVFGALKNNITSFGFKEGASTITQQLVKNTHLKSEKTIKRKVQEIRIAKEIERKYSKNEILEMYLNILYFGNNQFGIQNASKFFFSKSINELSLSEGALLAGIINNPFLYNPILHPKNALKRRNAVLSRMLDQKYISENEYKTAINEDLDLDIANNASCQYVDSVINEACSVLGITKEKFYEKNLTVLSYCDKNLQNYIQNLIFDNSIDGVVIHAIVSNSKNGRIIAECSNSESSLTNYRRQPGSIIKPILVYAPALENRKLFTCSPIVDERTSFGGWEPSNFNDKYYGLVSVKESLSRSLNVTAVKILDLVGVENAKKIAEKFGITFSNADSNLSLALGVMGQGLTLEEINNSYRVLANNGFSTFGHYIKAIIDANGKELYSQSPRFNRRVIEPETAYLVTDCLLECSQNGTGKIMKFAGDNIATKTGTVGNSNGNTDAYCVAYSPNYTVSIRISSESGYMENSISGGGLPTLLACEIFKYLSDTDRFTIPDGIVFEEIDMKKWKSERVVALADQSVLIKDRKIAVFNKCFLPKKYPKNITNFSDLDLLLNFNYFEIVNRVFD